VEAKMIGKKMEDAINKQINAELYSEYMYLAMSAYFESLTLRGFANWMRVQAGEEHKHAMKFFDHLVDRGGRVKLDVIQKPELEWKSPIDAFEVTYKHEQLVTSLIHTLVEVSNAEKDYAVNSMLKWFVDEQVEEESSADEIRQKLKMIGSSSGSLLYLDKQLAKRDEGEEDKD
jgi:ferritin